MGFVYLPYGELQLSKVKTFLNNYHNPNTKRNLRTSITNFFEAMYEEAKRKQLDSLAEKYFNEKRDYEKDVEDFLNHLNGAAPLTIKLKISNVKTFLLENNVEIPQKFWRKVNRRINGSRALNLDRIPTSDELKKLLFHMPIHGKALFLTLESSGMRIGELLQSHLDDLYLNEEPTRIQLRGEITKTGNPRHVFFSREAHEALIEWLKVREDYLKSAVGKSHLYDKNFIDSRIFPFDSSTAYSMWSKALHKSGLNGKDKSTGREKIHPHTLRKFFRTRLGAAGIPVDVVEALMGHEGYLTEVYRRYTLDDLRKFYLKGESALLVFTEVQEVTKLRKEVEERNKSLQNLVTELTTKNLTLENIVTGLASENKSLKFDLDKTKARVEKLEKTIEEKVNSINEKLAKLQPKA
jgi:integrase